MHCEAEVFFFEEKCLLGTNVYARRLDEWDHLEVSHVDQVEELVS